MGFLNPPGPVTTQTNSANAFALPYWNQYLSQLNNTVAQNPITPYGGPTVAPQNQMQNTASDMAYGLATNGSPAGNAANSAITAQALGAIPNPYATTANPYMGVDPYTQQVINSTNQNMADAYARGTSAQTMAAAAQQGAYGGSGYQEQQAANNKAFANSIGNVDSNLLNQNYYNNANLAENSLNRATNAFQQGLGNQLYAANLGLWSQGQDWNAINGLYGLGSANQQNTQNTLNAMQNYYTQTQQAPYVGFDLLGNALSRYSNANNVTSLQQPGSSPIMNATGIIGAGATILNTLNPGGGG